MRALGPGPRAQKSGPKYHLALLTVHNNDKIERTFFKSKTKFREKKRIVMILGTRR